MAKHPVKGTPLVEPLESRAQEIYEIYKTKGGNISLMCREMAKLEQAHQLADAKVGRLTNAIQRVLADKDHGSYCACNHDDGPKCDCYLKVLEAAYLATTQESPHA